jgi:uncharacterized protein YecT (DUF1311 family)
MPRYVTYPVYIMAMLFGPSVMAGEKSEAECLRLHPGITSPVEYATCTSDVAETASALGRSFGQLRAHVPAEDRPRLDAAQQAWLRYRDTQCAWDAGSNPGSTGFSSDVIACTADMNRKRANELDEDLRERWQD